MIAKIAVSAATFAIDKPYSYRVPENMELLPGMRVIVPFGRGNRRTEGVVLATENTMPTENLKTVERRLDETPVLTGQMLKLAAFLRERYFCTFYDAIRVMLPAGMWFRTEDTYRLSEDTTWQEKPPKKAEALKILNFLRDCGGETTGKMLRILVEDAETLEDALQYLIRKKWIVGEMDYSRQANDKTERIAVLNAPAEEVREYASGVLRAPMQKAVLELLCNLGSASVKELCYFTGAKSATVKRLESLGYLRLEQREVLRCSEIRPAKPDGPLVLNQEQQDAFLGLRQQMQEKTPGIALLYGVTGSGKTSVYLKLIRQCLDNGKAAMLLVPEIALTPQLLSLLVAYFGQTTAVLHSSLSVGERYDQWKRVRSGEAKVIVGTRSAVFAPSSQLGLIILDEEQEHSYKSEMSPRYSAKEVAIWRGFKENALVLLGSATPSVESMYRAKQGQYRLYRLKERFGGRSLPQVRMVDMREEIKLGNDKSFSADLLEAIRDTHNAGKQTVLFLNRRGAARALVCVECGEAPECPGCSTRLTYHSANGRMMCHYCGFSRETPRRCPTCDGPLKTVGTGTQRVQQELLELCPDLEVARMDSDTVSASNTHEKILDRFQKERVPVLIGTQMVAKGLNLPEVTLVGVLDADMSLYSGSYRAAETTFNMLTQVVGRSGRGDTAGQAIVQTMVPQHQVLNLAAKQDYDGFYDLEIQMRQIQMLPPFGDVTVVTFVGQEEYRVLQGAVKFRDSLIDCMQQPPYADPQFHIYGPAPCAVAKINYNFRYRLTLRGNMTHPMRGLLAHLLRQFMKDGVNRGVSAFVDINGFEE